ncbi:MAG: DUF47 family protein [Cyanobacteria bacterium P01_H01_bin.74]
MIFSLLPREEKFIKLLTSLEGYANESARLLKTIVDERNNERLVNTAAENIHHTRKASKKIIILITQEICRTLVTPFDREDIQEFATVLYQIPKRVDKAMARMLTHEIHPFENDFNQLVDIIDRQTEALDTVIQELKGTLSTKTIHTKVGVLDELEEEGDVALSNLIASSFMSIADTRELILRKDIYELLESITDLYRDAANIVLRIILKHS